MLPTNVTWVGCQGSEPHFRGYPCGLWTVFHLLTVQAAQSGPDKGIGVPWGFGCQRGGVWTGCGTGRDAACRQRLVLPQGRSAGRARATVGCGAATLAMGPWRGTAGSGLALPSPPILCLPPELPLEVLSTMRCYVRHFFGCQECAQHFEAMAAESMDQVAGREEAVLWLWSHHNEVNARLAGKGGPQGGEPGWLPKGKGEVRWKSISPPGWSEQMAALGCSVGDILLSSSPVTGDSSWSRSTRQPWRCSWVLHAPHRELPKATMCPRRTSPPEMAPPNVPVPITISSCWMLQGVYISTGGGLPHMSPLNPLAGSGPCRK